MTVLGLRRCAIVVMATSTAAFSTTQCLSDAARCHTRGATSSPFRISSGLSSDADDSSHEFDDFAEFSSPQLASSEDAAGDDPFLSSLQSRVRQVEETCNTLPLMILDTMLPRQILQIQIQNENLKALMRNRLGKETPTLGMLGMAKLSTGQTVPLKTGVEVQIIQLEKATGALPPDARAADGEERWDISLRAGRRFVIAGDVEKTAGGWTEAQVTFLDSQKEEDKEVQNVAPSEADAGGDRLSVARAISKARQFTEPNMNMKGGASLVQRWIELATVNERHPGQIEALLRQLGDMPPEHEPTERALWVGALINPLPSMGVATEIRPALLVSKQAEERVQVALEGIIKSIKHMEGSARLW